MKSVRSDVGLSQKDVADEMSKRRFAFNASVIGKIERGERRVTVGEAAALADVLGTSVERLLDQRDELSKAYDRRDRGRHDLSVAGDAYMQTLLRLAHTADRASTLSDMDRDWLSTELEAHTPARVAAEQHLGAEGILHELEIDPTTPYVATLLRRLEADNEALRRVRDDG